MGGGGLASSVAAVLKGANPAIRVVAARPAAIDRLRGVLSAPAPQGEGQPLPELVDEVGGWEALCGVVRCGVHDAGEMTLMACVRQPHDAGETTLVACVRGWQVRRRAGPGQGRGSNLPPGAATHPTRAQVVEVSEEDAARAAVDTTSHSGMQVDGERASWVAGGGIGAGCQQQPLHPSTCVPHPAALPASTRPAVATGVAVAAFQRAARSLAGKHVVVVVCGGNLSGPQVEEVYKVAASSGAAGGVTAAA